MWKLISVQHETTQIQTELNRKQRQILIEMIRPK